SGTSIRVWDRVPAVGDGIIRNQQLALLKFDEIGVSRTLAHFAPTLVSILSAEYFGDIRPLHSRSFQAEHDGDRSRPAVGARQNAVTKPTYTWRNALVTRRSGTRPGPPIVRRPGMAHKGVSSGSENHVQLLVSQPNQTSFCRSFIAHPRHLL